MISTQEEFARWQLVQALATRWNVKDADYHDPFVNEVIDAYKLWVESTTRVAK